MALGRQADVQSDLLLSWSELPRSQGHPFYDTLPEVLRDAGFDRHVETLCQPHYSSVARGRKSLPPGRYFRMLLVGYLEGIDSERGIEWRCADSLSLREFLLLASRERVPDHSWLSRTRSRLPLEVHDRVFAWVLQRLAEHGLIKGARIGVDASTMEANAALRTIVCRDTGEGYREMLKRLATESGIETPTADDLIRLDRKRPGKKLSNEDWQSRTDEDARIARMKDGRTRLAYKPEHSLDLDTGAALAAPVHHADRGDTKTLPDTLAETEANLAAVDLAPTCEEPAEVVADKGYHSRDGLKELSDSAWRTRISEPAPPSAKDGILRWHGDEDARRAVYANRRRLLSGIARQALKLRAEIVERGFALTLDRGGMRRTWLRGRDNVQKRYLIHIAGYNLGLVMRLLTGCGTPRRWAAAHPTVLWVCMPLDDAYLAGWIAMITDNEPLPVAGGCFLIATADGSNPNYATRC
jgi:transposase